MFGTQGGAGVCQARDPWWRGRGRRARDTGDGSVSRARALSLQVHARANGERLARACGPAPRWRAGPRATPDPSSGAATRRARGNGEWQARGGGWLCCGGVALSSDSVSTRKKLHNVYDQVVGLTLRKRIDVMNWGPSAALEPGK